MIKKYFNPITGRAISRQRHWQIKQAEAGRCITCGKKQPCLEHYRSKLIASREANRRRKGSQRRNLNSKSYQLKNGGQGQRRR